MELLIQCKVSCHLRDKEELTLREKLEIGEIKKKISTVYILQPIRDPKLKKKSTSKLLNKFLNHIEIHQQLSLLTVIVEKSTKSFGKFLQNMSWLSINTL